MYVDSVEFDVVQKLNDGNRGLKPGLKGSNNGLQTRAQTPFTPYYAAVQTATARPGATLVWLAASARRSSPLDAFDFWARDAPPGNVDRLDLECCRQMRCHPLTRSQRTQDHLMAISLDRRFCCTSELATAWKNGVSHCCLILCSTLFIATIDTSAAPLAKGYPVRLRSWSGCLDLTVPDWHCAS